jgi:2-polyprenyl-3-methyl-5-hydroxy-6-metoxy-1,4-benzoquinol methylase
MNLTLRQRSLGLDRQVEQEQGHAISQEQGGILFMDRKDWNARYAAQELLWGTEPNRFLAAELDDVPPRGRALVLACGEGRNALWLAKLGWVVTAVDYSEVAIERARRLAAEQHVEVEWIEADVTTFASVAGAFQLVIIAYLHLPGTSRRAVLAHAASALCVGGTLFMVGHARLNLTQGVGGPRQPELLWEPSEIREEVAALGLSVQRAEHVLRPVETTDGVKDAIDTLLLARRQAL